MKKGKEILQEDAEVIQAQTSPAQRGVESSSVVIEKKPAEIADNAELQTAQRTHSVTPRPIATLPAEINTTIPKAQALGSPEENPYQQLKKAYGENLARLDTMTQSFIDERNQKMLQDEEARKRERRIRTISGIGDTLSSLANLIGVGYNASNQNQSYNTPAIRQKIEQEQDKRKGEIDRLSAKIEAMQRDAINAKLAMQQGLAGYKQAELSRRAKAQADAAGLAEGARQFDEKQAETARQFDEKMGEERKKNKVQAELAKEKGNAEKAKAAWYNRRPATSDSKANKNNITLSYTASDGSDRRYDVDKNTLAEVGKRNIAILRDDVAKMSGFENWKDYYDKKADRKIMSLVSESDKKILQDLDRAGFKDEDLESIIYQYGTLSDKFMSHIENAATGKKTEDAYSEFK